MHCDDLFSLWMLNCFYDIFMFLMCLCTFDYAMICFGQEFNFYVFVQPVHGLNVKSINS